jgi:hypothetical protein
MPHNLMFSKARQDNAMYVILRHMLGFVNVGIVRAVFHNLLGCGIADIQKCISDEELFLDR